MSKTDQLDDVQRKLQDALDKLHHCQVDLYFSRDRIFQVLRGYETKHLMGVIALDATNRCQHEQDEAHIQEVEDLIVSLREGRLGRPLVKGACMDVRYLLPEKYPNLDRLVLEDDWEKVSRCVSDVGENVRWILAIQWENEKGKKGRVSTRRSVKIITPKGFSPFHTSYSEEILVDAGRFTRTLQDQVLEILLDAMMRIVDSDEEWFR